MRVAKILELRVLGLWPVLLLGLCSLETNAQNNRSVRLLEFKYGFQIPLADMNDRFGANTELGIALQTVGIEQKMIFGIEGMFFFGSNVKEDVLSSLRAFDGSVIGIDGYPGDINLKERGFYVGLQAGKIFHTGANPHKLTGIRTQIGAGLLQHKIRVQDNGKSVVALEDKYLKGYDRLTNGPAIHLGLGYQYQSPLHNLHFHIMGHLYGARTQSRRDLDFASGEYLDQKRTDILAGLSIAYIVTISRVDRPEHIYY